MNQWVQLKSWRLGAPGSGLIAAMNGCMKHKIVVANPRDAWKVSVLHVPSSTNITTIAINVRMQVMLFRKVCHLKREEKKGKIK